MLSSNMTKEEIERKIQEIVHKIATQFQPEKIILFGSYAWGEPNEWSDIDLFIVKDAAERRIDRARKVREIIWGSGLPVDILVYTPEEVKRRLDFEDFFIDDIITKGKLIYSAV